MKQKIRTLKIEPCTCDAEGQIFVELIPNNMKLECYYRASDEQIQEAFKIGVEKEAFISLEFDKIQSTDKREKRILPTVVGTYKGIFEEEDEKFYIIESLNNVFATNEHNKFEVPASIGEWVEASGEFVLHLP